LNGEGRVFHSTVIFELKDGKINEKGLPSLLKLAVSVPYFGDEIRLTSPPWAVQKAIFAMLAPIGRLLAYRAQYPYPRPKNAKAAR